MTPKRGKHSVRHGPKPKLLLDEALPPRANFPLLNQYCNVRHILEYGLSGATDETIYRFACQEQRMMVTTNIKHFKPMLEITPSGVSMIGVSTKLSNKQIDAKLTSLVKKLSPTRYHGQYFSIVKDR